MSRIGIVAPLTREAATFLESPPKQGSVVETAENTLLCVSGLGRERAERAARALVGEGAESLVSFGLAGGLDPELRPGELLLPAKVLAADGSAFPTDLDWRRRLEMHLESRLEGKLPCRPLTLIETETVLKNAMEKSDTWRRSGAAATDMESTAVARVAREAGLPLLVARSICDPAELAIPECALVGVDEVGGLRLFAFLRGLARRPWEVGRLLKLRRAYQAAQATLRQLVQLAGPRLMAP